MSTRSSVALVIPTHNRLEYTKKCIPRLLEDTTEQFDLYLWDNASTDETSEYLKSLKDNRIIEVVLSKENMGQTGAMNHVWGKTKAELVGKLDNDCLVTPGWTRTLARAHKEISKLGAIGTWHFFPDDFDYERAKHKIQKFGNHQIFRHPWIAGSGFILKRNIFTQQGFWKSGAHVGTSYYFLKMAAAGYINGWYYPLILQEHMDDQKSSHCLIKNKETFCKYKDVTYSLKARRYHNIEGRVRWRQEIIRNLLDDPYEPRYYLGWRRKWMSVKRRIHKLING